MGARSEYRDQERQEYIRRYGERTGRAKYAEIERNRAESEKKLYRDAARFRELRDFEKRYGSEHGREVYGAVVGKVAREEAAERPGGVKVEQIPGHVSFTRRGKREWVRGHDAYIHAHPHSRGHHGGRCGPDCRRSMSAHKHRRGSSRGG